MKRRMLWVLWLMGCTVMNAGTVQILNSPDGRLEVKVEVGSTVNYQLVYDGQMLMTPSTIGMKVEGGTVWGKNAKLKSKKIGNHIGKINAFLYQKAVVEDNYNELTLNFQNFKILFRAYDEGMAYRFQWMGKNPITIEEEQEELCFPEDFMTRAAFANAGVTIDEQFGNSYENCYAYQPISQINKEKLYYMPLMVEANNGVKICITESDLENYPGMYLMNLGEKKHTLTGIFPQYPAKVKHGGLMGDCEQQVVEREKYLVKAQAGQAFPWRIISVSAHDEDLLKNDMVYRLASPNRLTDTSWIKPGKVAWEWWNSAGLFNVPFKAGMNTDTYKYFIDFAAKNKIEYIILDGGWSNASDLFMVNKNVNLPEVIAYGKQKNVGIILWAGYYVFEKQMEEACRHYSEMGVKGFKVDFIDRDDAAAVNFHYRTAETAAKYRMVIDFHGTYKPTGLNRTYPNVLNYEAVNGQEQNKWSTVERYNQVEYDVHIPFLRMMAGPMDYTQGAMINKNKKEFYCSVQPMSQGTRCHQLAMYVVFLSPLNMLCDSPTLYEKEPVCTSFISQIPTIWDETFPLKSKVGEYVSVARRWGNIWYLGTLNNWQDRDLEYDLSFLDNGDYEIEVYRDGPNVEKHLQDFQKEKMDVPANRKMKIHLAPGGGVAMKFMKK